MTDIFNEREAAAYLRVSAAFLRAARHKGTGPAFSKLGRCVRYRREALDAYMATNEQGGAQ